MQFPPYWAAAAAVLRTGSKCTGDSTGPTPSAQMQGHTRSTSPQSLRPQRNAVLPTAKKTSSFGISARLWVKNRRMAAVSHTGHGNMPRFNKSIVACPKEDVIRMAAEFIATTLLHHPYAYRFYPAGAFPAILRTAAGARANAGMNCPKSFRSSQAGIRRPTFACQRRSVTRSM